MTDQAGGDELARARAPGADWTFMVYMAADNNLEPYAMRDLNELEYIGSSQEVDIIVQLDRHSADDPNAPWSETRRFHVMHDTHTTELAQYEEGTNMWSMGELDMSTPGTLADFVEWGVTNYPAEHYALVLWDHGKGWQGICSDGGRYMTLPELTDAMELAHSALGQRLDIVGMDACNMAMIEVFYQLAPYADYAIGSEKEEDANGWPYDDILYRLHNDPAMTPEGLSRTMVDEYYNQTKLNSAYSTVLASVNLTRSDSVRSAMDAFSHELTNHSRLYGAEIAEARTGTEHYPKAPYPYDLYHFAEMVEIAVPSQRMRYSAAGLMDALDDATVLVLRFRNPNPTDGAQVDNAHGLGVYLPYTEPEQSYIGLALPTDTHWGAFLSQYWEPKEPPTASLEAHADSVDSDGDGIVDGAEISYSTDATGLQILLDVYDQGGERVLDDTFQIAIGGEGRVGFDLLEGRLPSSYYKFHLYLVDSDGTVHNNTFAGSLWLGSSAFDLGISGLTFLRTDGGEVWGRTGMSGIAGMATTVEVHGYARGVSSSTMATVTLDVSGQLHVAQVQVDGDGQWEVGLTIAPRLGENDVLARVASNESEMCTLNNVYVTRVNATSQFPTRGMWLYVSVRDRGGRALPGVEVTLQNTRTLAFLAGEATGSGYRAFVPASWFREGENASVTASYGGEEMTVFVTLFSEEVGESLDISLDVDGPGQGGGSPGASGLLLAGANALALALLATSVALSRPRKSQRR